MSILLVGLSSHGVPAGTPAALSPPLREEHRLQRCGSLPKTFVAVVAQAIARLCRVLGANPAEIPRFSNFHPSNFIGSFLSHLVQGKPTMVIRIFVLTSLLSLICGPASARPLEQGPFLPKFDQLDASGRKGVARSDIPTPVFRTATAGTTFFGGTYWAADSMRWEAYKDHLWTFDSGEGSSLVPAGGPQAMSLPTSNWVNPFKEPGRHATMEGWIGFDNTYSNINYFRRIGSNDSRFGSTKCVGQLGGLGGIYSFWCGVFPGEAIQLCYAGGQGYGNAWNVCIEHPFSYAGGNVTLSYLYKNETEDGFDYTHVYIDTSGNGDLDDRVEPIVYTGAVSGQETLQLSPGHELPNSPGQIKIQFCVASDGAWSDQDGLNPTICGAFAVDNIVITGGVTHTATFESGNDGWALAAPAPGLGGEWFTAAHGALRLRDPRVSAGIGKRSGRARCLPRQSRLVPVD